MNKYAFQDDFIAHAKNWFFENQKRGSRVLYSSPTGSGKSVMQLRLREFCKPVIVTNRAETAKGYLDKLGYDTRLNMNEIRRLCESENIYTPIRLLNCINNGLDISNFDMLVIDEAHHSSADTYQRIYQYSNSLPLLGMTATPYMGNPKRTLEFLEFWGGGFHQILSLKQAMDTEVLATPTLLLEPLVDDDTIKVDGSDFVVSSMRSHCSSKADSIVDVVCEHMRRATMPSMLTVPSRENLKQMELLFKDRNIEVGCVTADTPSDERQKIFDSVLACERLLIHVNIVSEGVDLPMRRLFDASPTMSPVRWMQQLGRILRPSEQSPEYVCMNRNLERHVNLLAGVVPAGKIAEIQTAFPTISKRLITRTLGFESLGKFKPTNVALSSGVNVTFYTMSSVQGNQLVSYSIILHPQRESAIIAEKRDSILESGNYIRGKWRLIDSVPDVMGFASASPSPITDKQAEWWARDASRHGIDSSVTPDRKQFQLLPVLSNCRIKL